MSPILLVSLAFFGIAVLGCSLLAGQLARRWWTTAATIVVLPAMAFAVYWAAQPPTGWPATAKPPKSALFVAGTVREPNRVEHDPGEIDLWLVPPGFDHPRSYRLPYSRQLHEQVAAAMRATKRGERVGVRAVARRHGERGPRVRYQAYRFPTPQSPPKD